MSRKTKGIVVVGSLLIVLVLIALACKGPVGPAGPAGPTSVVGTAVIGIRPDTVPAKTAPGTFTFWGWGFQPGESVTITMLKAMGGEDWIIGGAVADDNGVFMRTGVSVVGTAALPADVKEGTYAVKAVGLKGTVATCVFLVTVAPTPTPTKVPATPTATPKP